MELLRRKPSFGFFPIKLCGAKRPPYGDKVEGRKEGKIHHICPGQQK
jgi:hypothetical protein